MPKWEVDQHPKKQQIIKALIKGDKSQRGIAKQYDISHAAVRRYMNAKLIQQVAKSKKVQEKLTEQAFVEKIDEIENMLREILEEARNGEDRDNHLAIKTIAEIRKGLEFLAKIHGMIKEQTVINIFNNPMFVQVQNVILDATKEHPEIREKIVKELGKLE